MFLALHFVHVAFGFHKYSFFDLIIFFVKLNELLLNKPSLEIQLLYLFFDYLSHKVNFFRSHWTLRFVSIVLNLRSCHCYVGCISLECFLGQSCLWLNNWALTESICSFNILNVDFAVGI